MIYTNSYRTFIHSILMVCAVVFTTQAQTKFYNNGSDITILKGTSITVKGDFVNGTLNTTKGTVANGGEVRIENDLINNANNSVFSTDSGKVEFFGDTLQKIVSDSVIKFNKLVVNKPNNELQLETDIRVRDSLFLKKGNLHMNEHDIELGFTGKLVGETNAKRLYGKLSYVYATRSISSNTYNIAGLGLSIETTNSLGTTYITRAHDAQGGASNGSIKRYFKIKPSTTNQTVNSISIAYLDTTEVDILDEAKFAIWLSNNDGLVWNRQTSIPYKDVDSVTATTIALNGTEFLVTLAESDCDSLPVVDLGADTMYLCQTDTLFLDAKNKGLFFKWSTGETTQINKVTTAAKYTVAVTDANGCVGVDFVHVFMKPYPVASFTVANVCQDFTSTFLNNSTYTADSVTYTWDFGDPKLLSDTSLEHSPTFVFDTAGTYPIRLIVTSDFNCIDTATFNHIVHPNPEANFNFTSVCLDSISKFTDNSKIATGGGINTRHWDFGDLLLTNDTANTTNPTFVFDTSGTYTTKLIVRSNAACTDTIEKTVTVHPRPVPQFSFNNAGENESIQLQNLSTINSGNMSYKWNFGDGITTTVANPTKSYASFGTYTILLEATSDFSCWDTLSQVVEISDIPNAAFSVNDTCQTLTVRLENTSTIGGIATLNYEWKFGDGTTSTDFEPTKTYTKDSTYTVWLIVTSSNNQKDSTSQKITIHPKPITGFSFVNKCADERVTFTNQTFITRGFYQSAWSFGDGTTSTFGSPNKTYTTAGDYTVELLTTSNFGCTDTVSKSITIHPLPILNLGGTITTCGDSLVLDAENTGSAYLWNTSSSQQIIVAKTSGKYNVTITSPNQCKLTEAVDISLNSLFTPNLGDDRSACVQTTLDAGNPGSTYKWGDNSINRTLLVTQSGTYNVDIIDQNGCVGADTIIVNIHQNPTVSLGNDTTVCSGENIVLDAGNLGATYKWSTGATTQTLSVNQSSSYSVLVTDVNNCTASANITLGIYTLPIVKLGNDKAVCATTVLKANNPNATYLWSDGSTADSLFIETAGTYILEVTNGNACKNSDTIEISILPKPIVELGEDKTTCNNGTIVLDAGTDGNKYLWNGGATSQFLFARSTGTYSVTVTNSSNCSTSDAVKVTVLNQVEVNIGQDFTLCAGKTVTLDAENDGSTYTWGSSVSTTAETNQTKDVTASGTYWVEVKTTDGCIGADTIKIGITSNTVEAQFLSTSLIDVGDTIQFIELASPDSVDYLWSFGDGVSSLEQDPMHTYFIAGNYDVSLTVSNELCSDQITKGIVVRDLRGIVIEPEVAKFFEIIEFSVYPNPFTEQDDVKVMVNLSEEATSILLVYDLNGHLLLNTEVTGQNIHQILPLEYLTNGLYIVKLMVNNNAKSLRLQKL